MEFKIALAGNPNTGKTTLFNALTGSNQFVGNWPGVTVEKKEGKLMGHPDVIITDPPRAGMHDDVIKTILAAEPTRIVYVSCNPATQARDLQLLSEKYAVKAVQPVDMFPHTHHVENVVLLSMKQPQE